MLCCTLEFCTLEFYTLEFYLIHRLNRTVVLYELLCRVKFDKINHLSATQSIPTTNEPVVAVNGPAQILTKTDKLVVTIPEDFPLDENEISLLAKGVNFIPTTPVTDNFQVKEDIEKFFRRLRLRAHFHGTSENTHHEAHDNAFSETIASNSSNTDDNNANHQHNTKTQTKQVDTTARKIHRR